MDSPAHIRGFVGGRGTGKSWVGAYDMLKRASKMPERLYSIYAPTYPMLRDNSMRCFLQIGQGLGLVREVNRSEMRATLYNGTEVLARSLDNPEHARGPSLSGVWMDEASLVPSEAYEIVIASLREQGQMGWLSATFTPKGQQHWTYKVFGKPGPDVALFHARTLDNPFLPAGFYEAVRAQYTARLAAQELDAQFIGDSERALWKRDNIEKLRVTKHPDMRRIVVAIDPASTSKATSDETGIVVAGLGTDGQGYVLADHSLQATPAAWGKQAVTAYHTAKADRIIGEANNGGEMVELTIRTVDKNASYKAVHASRGKAVRAEPIAALYEQGKIHHVGTFMDLENQLCQWEPGDPNSPDRLDALVWALTELMLTGSQGWSRGPIG